ncbi:bifunctional UDP-N-acetylglucosamine diphosphorylase/glucosamine-1-phosphate N-acetyltransferase GlmU [Prochlorothrix hollandica]|uniref:Bifunctional protein GlmU n=1 Tax=Prochlorothrix hollandica PCC 9006 = CALU 1027 TaxID=317619 RepID=A0A0M2PYM9_PROHO|nr:bifunctional UDP-N-acetylglucosamine diphosphorylase/glucosamine-1-phosphate N-acetyltransferase GlmU [Prochlorothrix hollandica]KKI99788.1 bifunctional N-acetylglucosamine-1-phosphate uridyltransferase/glucosamine-1-phosphate acetyltransferase [Prochlorothrix hollandica PCC 9006 = CALU 1027]
MVAVAILAAGKGTRMKSGLPKVLHQLGGRSLVEWVIRSIEPLPISHTFVIVGYQAESVQIALQDYPHLTFVQQQQQLGTGHAVQQVMPYLEGFEGELLVLNGDVPLLRTETLEQLLETHRTESNQATLLTAQAPDPQGYGRVFCDSNNRLTQIIEHRDCTPAQRQNHRINAGVYCFSWPALAQALPRLTSANDQQEYYLTDVVNHLSPITALDVEDFHETLGINDRRQLAEAYEVLQTRIKDRWMMAGVTLIDPDSITLDDAVDLGADVVIEPQTHLRGRTAIGAGCRIGPNSLIENSQVGAGSTVLYSVLTDSQVGEQCRVGPFAHLRGEAQVGDRCRVGNFVEIKKSQVGDRSNVAHLSYLGDATLGQAVNVGAGTITANYDGVHKHPTVIGDGTKVGANSVLVAPLTVGSGVTIAAGSTITEDVPDGALALGRSRQVVKPDWTPRSIQSPTP